MRRIFFISLADEKKSEDAEKKTDDDAAVEDDKEEEKKSKTKTVDKTVWDWDLMNESRPIWQRKYVENLLTHFSITIIHLLLDQLKSLKMNTMLSTNPSLKKANHHWHSVILQLKVK